MRAEPPPPSRRSRSRPEPAPSVPWKAATARQRCPYLEQILRERAGPFGMLVRYKADCHVDGRTHRFTGRDPKPPCTHDPSPCRLYRSARRDEDHRISRETD